MTKLAALTAVVLGIAFAQPGEANDDPSSELSHMAGGAALSGAVTAIADHYHMEHRALIGFGVASALGILAEGIQLAVDKDATVSSSALDAGSNMLGAAIGAVVTDRYILMPVVKIDRSGHALVGLVSEHSF